MKLLIVDDEWFVRERITQSIDLKALGINCVLTADDGLSGYEAAVGNRPEIILTDVRMPRMDGIELCNRIRKELPACTLILMSAYSDVEYLKSAIEVSALHYVDKPLKNEQLIKVLNDAVKIQTRHKHNLLKQKSMRRMLNSCLPITQAEILRKLLMLDGEDRDDLLFLFNQIFPHFPVQGTYAVALAGLRRNTEGDQSPLRLLEQFMAEQFSKNEYPALFYRYDEDFIIALVLVNSGYSDVIAVFQRMYDQWKFEDYSVQFTVGQAVTGLLSAGRSYRSALAIANRSFYRPYLPVCSVDASEPGGASMDLEGMFRLPSYKHIQNGNAESLLRFIDELGNQLYRNINTPVATSRLMFEHVLNLISSNARQNGLVLKDLKYTANILQHANTLDEILHALKHAAESMAGSVKTRPIGAFIVDELCTYIDANYTDPSLSLNMLAAHFHISPAYLCVLFKRERNITLNQYIIQRRMNYARTLLMDPTSRIKDVSFAVGYNDCNYFIRCFKKELGCTPLKFKEESLNEQKNVSEDAAELP